MDIGIENLSKYCMKNKRDRFSMNSSNEVVAAFAIFPFSGMRFANRMANAL